ncbi:uncharacterized protein LOC131215035 [Anopheles bellator]|uniref:uncharacterized protein LOC131215035 n=1 Tax=Anopheles bellator TaxID=139047 RepID=UPI002648B904|nr:uncharacterized protein LOC131215035 [Anopheles bellator]
MVHSEEKQWQMMFLFTIPEAVQDAIVYCQRSLRDFVRLHETLAAQINKLGGKQRISARQYLKELEEEIVSIGGEQKILVGMLTENVRSFQLYVRVTKMVDIGNEMADGYVSFLLRRSMEMPVVPKKLPPGVTIRRSAAELAEHYSIENILKLYRDECARKSKHPQWPSGSKEGEEKQKPNVSSTKRTVTVSPSRSLLKRTQERPNEFAPAVINVAARQMQRPFEGIGKQQKPQLQTPVEVKRESVAPVVAPSAPPSKQPRKELIEVKVEYPEPKQQWPLPSGVWKPGSRGRPPNAAKRAAALLEAAQKAQPNKVPKLPAVEHVQSSNDSSGDELVVMTAAYRQSRSNLQQALANLVGQRKSDEPVTARPMLTAAANLAKRIKPTTTTNSTSSGGAKLVKYSSSTVVEISSGSSPNSRSSSPSSGDSFDRRSPVSDFPPIASEPPVPTPLSIYELEQPVFLKFFGLYTPTEVQALRERKRERKRRSCNSTERKDFHYGRLDYYEQQQRRPVSQRPVLYSPPVTVAKKRKALPPAPTVATTSSMQVVSGNSGRSAAGPSRSFKHILSGLEDTSCIVCFKRGYTEELSSCMNCCNIYHIDCHDSNDPKASDELSLRQRENLCPNCL